MLPLPLFYQIFHFTSAILTNCEFSVVCMGGLSSRLMLAEIKVGDHYEDRLQVFWCYALTMLRVERREIYVVLQQAIFGSSIKNISVLSVPFSQ